MLLVLILLCGCQSVPHFVVILTLPARFYSFRLKFVPV